jgi:hypothetical protein
LFELFQKSAGLVLAKRDDNLVDALLLGEFPDGVKQNRSAVEFKKLLGFSAG